MYPPIPPSPPLAPTGVNVVLDVVLASLLLLGGLLVLRLGVRRKPDRPDR
ncbi:MAG: hypothetical protein ACR2FF_02230 [Mycobacteriales bacterium]